MFRSARPLLFLSITWVLLTSLARAETKVALLAALEDSSVLDLLALVEVELGAEDGVTLLERRDIDAVLDEQTLQLSGVVDAAQAIKTGQALSVDLLAVVEGDPVSKQQQVLGLVVFDAKQGVRLADLTIDAAPEESVSLIREGVSAAVAKFTAGRQRVHTVGLVGVRNVDLPRQRDGFCQAIGRLLERKLTASPDVALLERKFLELVRQERVITDKAKRDALLGSLQSMQIEISRQGDGLLATVFIDKPGGERRKISATSETGSAGDLTDKLTAGLLGHFDAAAPQFKSEPVADARRLMNEAEFRYRHADFHQAGTLAEAAIALAPDDPPLWQDAAKYFLWQAFQVLKPEWAAPNRTYAVFEYTPQQMEQVLVHTQRSLEVTYQKRRHESRNGGIVFQYPDGSFLLMPEVNVNRIFYSLLQSEVRPTPKGVQATQICQQIYRQIVVDILLPQYHRKMLEEPSNPIYWGYYSWLAHKATLFSPTAEMWADFEVDYGEQVIRILDRNGPVVLDTGRNERLSYVYLLCPLTSWPDTYPLFNSRRQEHYDKLRDLFTKMTKHARPGVQIFGQASLLWLDVRTRAISPVEASQRCREILKSAKSKITEAKGEGANEERMACYEAALNAIDVLPTQTRAHFRLLSELKDFMFSRDEVVLSVLRRTTRVEITNHGHYTRPQNWRPEHAIKWQQEWRLTMPLTTFPHFMETIERATDLLSKGRAIDGNEFASQEEVGFSRRRIYLQNPGIAVGVGQEPWIGSARVLAVEKLGLRFLSQPVVHNGEIYVVGMSEKGGEELHLFRIRIADQAVAQLSRLRMPPPLEKHLGNIDEPFKKRWASVVLSPQISGGRLFCATPRYGGIAVFPLDGSAPSRISPAEVRNMPTSFIADLAVAGERIFAVTSVEPEGESYVHWYDPDGDGWNVVASSRRAEAKTPLDHPVLYHPGAQFDAPRNRVLFFAREVMTPDGGVRGGMYEFDIRTRKIRRVTEFPMEQLVYVQRTSQESLLATFADPGFGVSQAIEFDMGTDRWRTFYSRSSEPPIAGLDQDQDTFQCNWNLWPPYTRVGNQLWSFLPFARVDAEDKIHRRIHSLEWRIPFQGARERTYSDHLQYLPKHKMVLYANQYSLWLLLVPDPDTPKRNPNLLAHYRFDKRTGLGATDASAREHHGQLVNGATWAPGRFGAAMQFDGMDDYVSLGNPSDLNIEGPISLAAWVKHTASDGYRNIVAHGMTKDPPAKVFLRLHNGNYEGGSWNGTRHEVTAKIPAEDEGNWVHLTATFDGRQWRLYRNGEEVAARTDATGAVKVAGNWAIGSSGLEATRCFKGAIDEVRIYSRALTEQEIRALAKDGTAQE